MKNLIEVLKRPENFTVLFMMFMGVVMVAFPEMALAQEVASIVRDRTFQSVITLGFGIFAFVSWINYIAGFSPQGALQGLIVPAFATFMAFQWTTVLRWFNLG